MSDKNDKITRKLLDEIQERELKIEAKDCLIRQQRDRIQELTSELANAKIDADSAKEELLIARENEAKRKNYVHIDISYMAIITIGIISFIASRF